MKYNITTMYMTTSHQSKTKEHTIANHTSYNNLTNEEESYIC